MVIDLKPIVRSPGESVPFSYALDLSALDFYGDKPYRAPVAVLGEVRNRAGILELAATVDAVIETDCARCGASIRREARIPISNVLLIGKEDEGEHDDVVIIPGEQFELDDLILAEVVFATDIAVLCGPECMGLCAVCGQNLNEGACACDVKEIDPRLRVLEGFKNKDKKQ